MHTYIHTCIHTYIQTYKHTYIHTYMHTYIVQFADKFPKVCFLNNGKSHTQPQLIDILQRDLRSHTYVYCYSCLDTIKVNAF